MFFSPFDMPVVTRLLNSCRGELFDCSLEMPVKVKLLNQCTDAKPWSERLELQLHQGMAWCGLASRCVTAYICAW